MSLAINHSGMFWEAFPVFPWEADPAVGWRYPDVDFSPHERWPISPGVRGAISGFLLEGDHRCSWQDLLGPWEARDQWTGAAKLLWGQGRWKGTQQTGCLVPPAAPTKAEICSAGSGGVLSGITFSSLSCGRIMIELRGDTVVSATPWPSLGAPGEGSFLRSPQEPQVHLAPAGTFMEGPRGRPSGLACLASPGPAPPVLALKEIFTLKSRSKGKILLALISWSWEKQPTFHWQLSPWLLCLWLISLGSSLFKEPCLGLHSSALFLSDSQGEKKSLRNMPCPWWGSPSIASVPSLRRAWLQVLPVWWQLPSLHLQPKHHACLDLEEPRRPSYLPQPNTQQSHKHPRAIQSHLLGLFTLVPIPM